MTGQTRRNLAQRLARLAANLVYRDIDLQRSPGIDLDGPILAVANHFGGLADAVLIIDALPRMPRIVARDVIWQVPVVGRLPATIGMIPVHRSADGGRASNDDMFRSAYEALGQDELVLIFPEGVTQDVPHMAQVRTGAARIALGARAAGVQGLRILPIGIHYEDKAGFRTRALVQLGRPIDLDTWAAGQGAVAGADDRAAVADLTATVDAALRHAAPDFADWPTAHALHAAAEVVLTDVRPVPAAAVQYGDLEVLAGRLNRCAEPARGSLVEVAARYRQAVRTARTSDLRVAEAAAMSPPAGGDRARWLLDLVVAVLLLPYALLGVLVAALPLLAVIIASRLRIAPAVRATLVPGVALLTFLVEWGVFAWQSLRVGGWDTGLAAVLLFPFLVGSLFVVAERAHLLRMRWRSRRSPRGQQQIDLGAMRSEVAERSWAAL
jgi:1-acyl-sn-glycerol-3-phosphate acyltransferase